MATFTSSLPDKTLEQLSALAQRLHIPKNQIINEALTKYFFEIERQQFIDSFERVGQDDEMKELAEMGLDDYLDHLNELDAKW
jgi:predicted transcriptional regulator